MGITERNRLRRKEIIGWSFYDFATTAFSTTILAVIFNEYYANVACGGETGTLILGARVNGAAMFGFVVAMASGIIALVSPFLGAVADYSGKKKRFAFTLCYLSILFTGLLFFIREGDCLLGAGIFVVAYFGYYGSLTLYNAFLPEISTEKTIGRVSGWGSTAGWLGGGLLLIINLLMLENGFLAQDTFLSAAIWMVIFTIPALLWLRERQPNAPQKAGQSYLRVGFSQVLDTLRHVRRHWELCKYFVAYLIYNDGMSTVVFFATIFASQVLGMNDSERILLILMVQGTGMIGSFIFGYIGDFLGHKRAIIITLVCWSLIVIWAFQLGLIMSPKTEFWMLAFIAGLMMGGNYVVSRSLLGLLTPDEHRAKFFGFFSLAGKFASLFGPLVYGVFIAALGDMQQAMLVLIIFFITGTVLLMRVNEQKGLEEKGKIE